MPVQDLCWKESVVGHRIHLTQINMEACWRTDNSVDCASRGLLSTELLENELILAILHGPSCSQHSLWRRWDLSSLCHHSSWSIVSVDRFSSFTRLRRVTAWLIRFARLTRKAWHVLEALLLSLNCSLAVWPLSKVSWSTTLSPSNLIMTSHIWFIDSYQEASPLCDSSGNELRRLQDTPSCLERELSSSFTAYILELKLDMNTLLKWQPRCLTTSLFPVSISISSEVIASYDWSCAAQLLHQPGVKETITNFCSSQGITWDFIHERAPHVGRLWAAQSKVYEERPLGNARLNFEDLTTVLSQIKAWSWTSDTILHKMSWWETLLLWERTGWFLCAGLSLVSSRQLLATME